MPRGRPKGSIKTNAATRHPLYSTWLGMRERCNNQNSPKYHNYGGRGIKVDPGWDDFWAFVRDIGPKPGWQYTVDRKNNNGHYSADNCIWALPGDQQNNRRNNRKITYLGRTQTLSKWADELRIEYNLLRRRLDKMSFVEAIRMGNQKLTPGWHHKKQKYDL